MTELSPVPGGVAPGLTDPTRLRDRAEDHRAFWLARREAELRELVTPELIEEHRLDPVGERAHHSAELQQVLNYVRSRPMRGKAFVYTERAFESYRIGVLAGRNEPVRFDDDRRFASQSDAAHAIFLMRLADLGVDVDSLTGGEERL